MIRRFLPLWLPVLLIVVAAAINYCFWSPGLAGEAMSDLPPRTLGGHTLGLSRAAAADPLAQPCKWRVRVSSPALAALGGLEMAYSASTAMPAEKDWCRVPTGGSQDALQVTPAWPGGKPPARLWVRGKAEGLGREAAVHWELGLGEMRDEGR